MNQLPRVIAGLALAAACALPSVSSAQPAAIPIQGFLADSGGVPTDGSNIPVSFRVYAAATGGAPLYEESVLLSVNEGRFVHYLGSGGSLDLSVFNGQERYVGVEVAFSGELLPRTRVGTTPYAAHAGRVAWSNVTGVPADLADGDSDTTYAAAFPLQRTGTTFGLSTSGCVAGEAWVWNGTGWECSPITAFSTGSGLSFSGGILSADTTFLQQRVAGSCGPTAGIRQVNPDGTVSCTPTMQQRVASTCPPNSSISAINADGTVTCETDDVGGGVTEVVAGNGLSGGGSTPQVTLSIDPTAVQVRVTATCSGGEFIQAIGEDGSVTCVPTPSAPVYTAGLGLTLTAGSFAISPTYVQRRLTNNCPANEYLYGVAEDGTPLCRPDVNTDSNTTYSNGLGLLLSGTTFLADTSYLQRAVAATSCPFGIASISSTGAVTCSTNNDTNTTYTANNGVALSGTTFSADFNAVQARFASHDCPFGIRSVSGTGVVTCAANNDTNSTYVGGDGITLSGNSFAVNSTVQRTVNNTFCTYGIAQINQNGSITCASNNDTNTWPSGFRNCPDANHYMYGINWDGSPNCKHLRDYINNDCTQWLAWSDNNRWCCDHLQHANSNGGRTGGWGQYRLQYWDASWGHIVGVRFSGGVDSNDWIYMGFRCW